PLAHRQRRREHVLAAARGDCQNSSDRRKLIGAFKKRKTHRTDLGRALALVKGLRALYRGAAVAPSTVAGFGAERKLMLGIGCFRLCPTPDLSSTPPTAASRLPSEP